MLEAGHRGEEGGSGGLKRCLGKEVGRGVEGIERDCRSIERAGVG